ncbi:MAG: monovalent cation/H+ antiporter complex subunit F [Lachnospiraceae bacterium]|nr:monovalent cation/H+ antiporter complex subunit F [Lachnospiraceae bacterium]
MGEGIPGLATAYEVLFTAALIFLAVMLVLCLVRAIIGPRVADRLVAVNMMGTIVMVIIAILALMLQEGYLGDICLIYAMISFLAVVVLTKVYMGVYIERENRLAAEKEGQDGAVSAQEAAASAVTAGAGMAQTQMAGSFGQPGSRTRSAQSMQSAQGTKSGKSSKKKSGKGKRRGNG